MKKLVLLAAVLVPAALCASTIFIEHLNYQSQSFELLPGTSHTIPLGDAVELRVLDMGDPVASVFKMTIARLDMNGQFITLCENQLIVPFSSEASLVFSKMGIKIRFVASPLPDQTQPDPNGEIIDATNPGPNG
jgi:hypothetical protein